MSYDVNERWKIHHTVIKFKIFAMSICFGHICVAHMNTLSHGLTTNERKATHRTSISTDVRSCVRVFSFKLHEIVGKCVRPCY